LDNRGSILLSFTEQTAVGFFRVALGISCTDLSEMTTSQRKSMSTETTFKDTSDLEKLREICNELCMELASDLEAENLKGSQVTLKIKTDKFVLKTKVSNLMQATFDAKVICQTALNILRKYVEECKKGQPLTLRLIGVRMSEFSEVNSEDKPNRDNQKSIKNFMQVNRNTIELETIECPLCGIAVEARSEVAFNMSHFEKCSAEMEKSPGGACASNSGKIEAATAASGSNNSALFTYKEGCENPDNKKGTATNSMPLSCKTRDYETRESFENISGQFPSHSSSVNKSASLLHAGKFEDSKKVVVEKTTKRVENKKPDTSTTVSCPICECPVDCDVINTHIDICLNKQTIGQIVASHQVVASDKATANAGKKRKLLTSESLTTVNNNKKPNKKEISIKSYFTPVSN
jgi:hypothetical protein